MGSLILVLSFCFIWALLPIVLLAVIIHMVKKNKRNGYHDFEVALQRWNRNDEQIDVSKMSDTLKAWVYTHAEYMDREEVWPPMVLINHDHH